MSIELLAPAGSPEALDAAIGEGADAVYLGLKNFNARMRSVNFTYTQFELALRSLRRMGKKLYVTVNTVFEQREADRMYQLLKYLSATGPDAVIVQDFGVLAMVRSEFPQLKIHASTQMNIASGRGVNALSRYNVSRVVLSRELSLEELRSIRAETNMELEVFVHGALCVSASGLCLFSSYLGGKSANRGMCTQACRRLYRNDVGGTSSDTAEAGSAGYYFSPADLQLLERIPDLAEAGINSLKIEGRMKSADYTGAVVSAYRLVLDAVSEGSGGDNADDNADNKISDSIAKGREILRGDFARSKTRFYFDKKSSSPSPLNWLNPVQDGGTGINLGLIEKTQKKGEQKLGIIKTDTQTKLAIGDSVRLHRKDDSERVTHKLIFVQAEREGGYLISVPPGFGKGDRVYLIQNKAMSKRYRPVIGNTTLKGRRQPGFEKAPVPRIEVSQKKDKNAKMLSRNKSSGFPDGIYVAVSKASDLYIVQSMRPDGVILNLDRKTARYLLDEGKPPLPFKAADITLSLDPFFPQADSPIMQDEILELVDLGYRQFMLNNPGHFPLFRDVRSDVCLAAGHWLYAFNTWAVSFLASLGADAFVSPLENNRQNLERTLFGEKISSGKNRPSRPPSASARSLFFVPVFVRPPLFRIRADLGKLYDFKTFSDSREEIFSLVTGPEGSTVIPEKPFSIIDKIPFLKESGFRRFIVDLSGLPLKKTDYKDLMRSVNDSLPLSRISRFNWKDGFFANEGAGGIGSKE